VSLAEGVTELVNLDKAETPGIAVITSF